METAGLYGDMYVWVQLNIWKTTRFMTTTILLPIAIAQN